MDRKITSFDKKGKHNTEETLRLARSRAEELVIRLWLPSLPMLARSIDSKN